MMSDDTQSENNENFDVIEDTFEDVMEFDVHSPVEMGEPISEDDINFDRSLPGQHTYLGEDSVAIDRSNFQEPGTVVSLKLIYEPGIVLIPGYTLPLMVTDYTEEELVHIYRDPIAVLPGCFDVPFLSIDFVGHVATIAYLVTIRLTGSRCTPVLLGQQRLQIMEIGSRSSDNASFCKGLVLSESSLIGSSVGPISRLSIPPSWCRFTSDPEYINLLPSDDQSQGYQPRVLPFPLPGDSFAVFNATRSSWCISTSTADINGDNDDDKRPIHLPCRKDVLAAVANGLTPHPSWIYSQYDLHFLIAEIRAELSRWTNTWHMDKWEPSLAIPFSYWLLQNLPLSCAQKEEFLKIDHVVLRLRACLHFIRSCCNLACFRCKTQISSQMNVICLSNEGSMQSYVNPHGFIFDMLTLSSIRPGSVEIIGSPSTEYSWFPGYAWTIIQCSTCNGHMGWRFTATSEELRPRLFWGFKRQALVHTPANGEEDSKDPRLSTPLSQA